MVYFYSSSEAEFDEMLFEHSICRVCLTEGNMLMNKYLKVAHLGFEAPADQYITKSIKTSCSFPKPGKRLIR